jgi:hypothetical protein
VDSRGLVIAWASNTTIDVDAIHLKCEECGLDSVDLTANIAVSGAGGLDTGSPSNSTGYYLWIVCNMQTSVATLIFSLSATVPTMPSGYDGKALLGWMYRNSSGNFYRFLYVHPGWFWWDEVRSAADFRKVDAGTETTWTAFTPLGPAIADAVKLTGSVYTDSSFSGIEHLYVRPTGSNWGTEVGSRLVTLTDFESNQTGMTANEGERPLGTGGQLDYCMSQGENGYIEMTAFHLQQG